MKRLLLLTCLFSITSASFAQINKGQWLVGGNISYSTSKNDVTNTKHRITNFQISPNVFSSLPLRIKLAVAVVIDVVPEL